MAFKLGRSDSRSPGPGRGRRPATRISKPGSTTGHRDRRRRQRSESALPVAVQPGPISGQRRGRGGAGPQDGWPGPRRFARTPPEPLRLQWHWPRRRQVPRPGLPPVPRPGGPVRGTRSVTSQVAPGPAPSHGAGGSQASQPQADPRAGLQVTRSFGLRRPAEQPRTRHHRRACLRSGLGERAGRDGRLGVRRSHSHELGWQLAGLHGQLVRLPLEIEQA